MWARALKITGVGTPAQSSTQQPVGTGTGNETCKEQQSETLKICPSPDAGGSRTGLSLLYLNLGFMTPVSADPQPHPVVALLSCQKEVSGTW